MTGKAHHEEVIERFWRRPPNGPAGYGFAVGLLVAASLPIALLHELLPAPNFAVLYLPVVIAVAILFGARPALVTALLAFVTYDLLFIAPRLQLTIADPAEWANLFAFLAAALATGQLASLARVRALQARQNERDAVSHSRVVQALASGDLEERVRAAAAILAEETGTPAILVQVGELEVGVGTEELLAQMRHRDAVRSALILAESGHRTARRWMRLRRERHAMPAEFGATFGRVRVTGPESDGWIILAPIHPGLSEPWAKRLLATAATLIGAAVLRDRLAREANEAEVLREADRMRGAMLNAVSHDLRTPLSAIIAAGDSLLQRDIEWSPADQREFLEEIVTGGRRLERMVHHLLDYSRIEAGALRVSMQWRDPAALITESVRHLRPLLGDRKLVLDLPSGMGVVFVDEVAIGEVITNLVENAVKHAPDETPITIRAARHPLALEFAVEDEGPGVDPAAMPHLFDTFTGSAISRRGGGTGLGLAIAKAMTEAHGGTIRVDNRPHGGARFTVTLPQRATPVIPEPHEDIE